MCGVIASNIFTADAGLLRLRSVPWLATTMQPALKMLLQENHSQNSERNEIADKPDELSFLD